MAKEKSNITDLTDDEIRRQAGQLEQEYAQLRFDHASKGLGNPMELREMRREIARFKTEMRDREIKAMSPEEIMMRSKLRARRRSNR